MVLSLAADKTISTIFQQGWSFILESSIGDFDFEVERVVDAPSRIVIHNYFRHSFLHNIIHHKTAQYQGNSHPLRLLHKYPSHFHIPFCNR